MIMSQIHEHIQAKVLAAIDLNMIRSAAARH